MTIATSTRMILTSSAKALGIPLPDSLNDRLAEAVDLLAKARRLSSERTRAELTDAVIEELRSGADPLDSPAVQRAALADRLGDAGVINAVGNLTERMIASALVDSADEILGAWSKDLAAHSDNLVTAAAELPSADLHDLASIQRAPIAYSHAVDALHRFSAAIQGAQQLAALAGVTVHDSALFYLGDPARLPELKRAAALRSEVHPSAWDAARLGITPRFAASLGEIMERLAANHQQRAEAARPPERQSKATKPTESTESAVSA